MKDIHGPGPINPPPWSLLPGATTICPGHNALELSKAAREFRETGVQSDLLHHALRCSRCAVVVEAYEDEVEWMKLKRSSEPPRST